jgi:hypothetical protein
VGSNKVKKSNPLDCYGGGVHPAANDTNNQPPPTRHCFCFCFRYRPRPDLPSLSFAVHSLPVVTRCYAGPLRSASHHLTDPAGRVTTAGEITTWDGSSIRTHTTPHHGVQTSLSESTGRRGRCILGRSPERGSRWCWDEEERRSRGDVGGRGVWRTG